MSDMTADKLRAVVRDMPDKPADVSAIKLYMGSTWHAWVEQSYPGGAEAFAKANGFSGVVKMDNIVPVRRRAEEAKG